MLSSSGDHGSCYLKDCASGGACSRDLARLYCTTLMHAVMGSCRDIHSVAKVELHLCSHTQGIGNVCVHTGGVCGCQLAAVRLVSARSVQVTPLPQRPEHGLHRGVGQRDAHQLARALDADVRPWVCTV